MGLYSKSKNINKMTSDKKTKELVKKLQADQARRTKDLRKKVLADQARVKKFLQK